MAGLGEWKEPPRRLIELPPTVARQFGLARPERIRKTLPRRPRRQRFLLARVRCPAGEPDDLERRPDATIRIGETFGVDLHHPQQYRLFEWPTAALHQRIGRAHATRGETPSSISASAVANA